MIRLGVLCCIILWLIVSFGISFNPFLNAKTLTQYVCNSIIHDGVLVDHTFKNEVSAVNKVVFLYSHNYTTLPEFAVLSQSITNAYCHQHNYSWVNRHHPSDYPVSPYWLRVQDLLQLSTEYPDNTIFVYMDLDACINLEQLDVNIDQFLHNLNTPRACDIYVGKDTTINRFVNTGVIIIRNTIWSRQMLNEWWGRYNPEKWKQTDGEWKCHQDKKQCVWAGDGYEQGAFEAIYSEDWNDSKSHIGILHMDLVSNSFKERKNTFIYHLMGLSSKTRIRFFTHQIDKYLAIKEPCHKSIALSDLADLF